MSDLVAPRYGAGSLADVMPSAVSVLAGGPDPLGLVPALDGVRRIAVLLVDGLGYHLLPAVAEVAPVMADVVAGRLGVLTPLTCGFPSTTPVSLVSLGTGVPPGEHGVLGFTVNIPGTTRVLNHIDWRGDPDPAWWQPVPTQFDRARAAGVAVSVVSRPEFAGSGLTVAAYRGAGYRGAADVDALGAEMLAALSAEAPALVYGYHPVLDTTGHVFGVGSEPWQAAASEVDRLLGVLVGGLPADAALLVTADHGQLNVPAEQRFDIDTDARLAAGVRVVAGEPRVRYLHTEPGALDDVLAAWRAVLGEAAWVASREEALATGWFGPVPPAHRERIGDVVVACQGTYAVLASAHEPPIVSALVGYHGSYTATEMDIPLIVVRGTVGGAG
ncbi:MAG TPA: alkaline phosphatase family protein [Rugosimonospora sp.]|nr:alkaline phosphatase family protein [Rugosimonospora sp.]